MMIPSERFAYIDPDWFWGQVQRGTPGECWPWTGPVDDRGYGMVWLPAERGSARAHRIALVLGTGKPLGRLGALHSCDNPPCCNYQTHLRPGTHAENMADVAHRARGKRHITTAQLAELRQRYGQGEAPAALAAGYGISLRHTMRIAIGTDRKHDDAPIQLPEWRRRGLALPQIKVTDTQVGEIRQRHAAGGVTQRALAHEYGVSPALICMIINGHHRAGDN